MSDLPPLPALRCFEAVARLGSITRAALALHVTHSAVSQQVRQLEELLGLSLFEREGRGLRLSENGRLYALQVREALQQIGAATRALRIRPRDGELVVALIPSFGQHWLLPRLPRFMQRCPGQRLRLLASLEPQDLRQGAAHVAIRMGHGGWEGLEQQHLFEDELLMVAAPHFNGGALPRTPAEVLAGPLIRSVEPWTPWCAAAGLAEPSSSSGLWINDSNLSIEAARLGQGVALERLSVAHALLCRGELVQLTDLRVPYAYPYWLVWPPTDDARVQGSRQAFAQWLQEEVNDYLTRPAAGNANAAIVA